MDFSSICIILLGSSFGLILRLIIQNNFKKNIGFDIQNNSIVNFIASFIIVLCGSTFGLILRLFIQNNLKINIGFNIQNTSIVNFISSFFLGILVALNFTNNNLLLLFYVGFLGCFSTFSSFIYEIFNLYMKGKFQRFFFHYIEVVFFSFLFFYLGYFIIQYF